MERRQEVGTTPEVPIACSLEAAEVTDRVGEWRELVGRARRVERLPGGTRAWFERRDAEAAAELAAKEQACCAFLQFALTAEADGVVLEVHGPPDAQPVIDALLTSAYIDERSASTGSSAAARAEG